MTFRKSEVINIRKYPSISVSRPRIISTMHPTEAQSAFGFYQKEKGKTKAAGSTAKKIKVKYEELCNKKKKSQKLKLKNAASQLKKGNKKDGSAKPGIADWTVRKGQFEQLKNGHGHAKSGVELEDSRIAGKKSFQHLLDSIDVDRFMR